MDNMRQIKMPIGEDEIRKAREILEKYRSGKKSLDSRIVNNEKWWKLRHWDLMETEENRDDPKPASGWLFNTIISKHADYMDAFPSADILPREQNDEDEAKRLSSIIPVVLKQNKFKDTYSEESWQKLKHGTGIFGVFWDTSKLNGLGDISIECLDVLSIFYEPGIKDIQKSKNLFTVELVDNDTLKQMYPNIEIKGSDDTIVAKYSHDDNIDTKSKSSVIDWYYKKMENGKEILHYCKFVGETVLYATENDPERAHNGLYHHGKYPFIFDCLFPETDMPVGFGFVDVCKHPQASIDIFNNAFEKNLQFGASPRYFSRTDGGINEDELADPNKLVVHIDGNLGEDSIRPIEVPTITAGNYINFYEEKINEMKETSGNRDINNGGTTSGVTAASGIAALQQTSGKLSRDQISDTYEAYKDVVYIVIELIRQFYSTERQFRIVGENGKFEFTSYSNASLVPQSQGYTMDGQDLGYRTPEFDIEVKAEKESAYSQLAQNELAIQFYNLGFFNPENVTPALACLEMMDFNGKQKVIDGLMQNGTLYQQLMQTQMQMLQMAEMVDMLGKETGRDYNMASAMADKINGTSSPIPVANGKASSDIFSLNEESTRMQNARKEASEVSQPR